MSAPVAVSCAGSTAAPPPPVARARLTLMQNAFVRITKPARSPDRGREQSPRTRNTAIRVRPAARQSATCRRAGRAEPRRSRPGRAHCPRSAAGPARSMRSGGQMSRLAASGWHAWRDSPAGHGEGQAASCRAAPQLIVINRRAPVSRGHKRRYGASRRTGPTQARAKPDDEGEHEDHRCRRSARRSAKPPAEAGAIGCQNCTPSP
jgi:hypothetical protein